MTAMLETATQKQAKIHAERAHAHYLKGYYRNAANEYGAAAFFSENQTLAEKFRALKSSMEDLIFGVDKLPYPKNVRES